MEVFHNNERLLIVNGIKNNERLVYIVNVKTKKVVNIMKQMYHQTLSIYSLLTFTVIKKPPEIYFLFFNKTSIKVCSIDERLI